MYYNLIRQIIIQILRFGDTRYTSRTTPRPQYTSTPVRETLTPGGQFNALSPRRNWTVLNIMIAAVVINGRGGVVTFLVHYIIIFYGCRTRIKL